MSCPLSPATLLPVGLEYSGKRETSLDKHQELSSDSHTIPTGLQLIQVLQGTAGGIHTRTEVSQAPHLELKRISSASVSLMPLFFYPFPLFITFSHPSGCPGKGFWQCEGGMRDVVHSWNSNPCSCSSSAVPNG